MKKKRRSSAAKSVLIAFLVVVLAMGGVGAYFVTKGIIKKPEVDTGDISRPTQQVDPNTTEDEVSDPDIVISQDRKDGFYNFLVVGRDATTKNTDVMMIVSFDVENSKIGIFQIPRDTYVDSDFNYYASRRCNAVFGSAYMTAYRKNKTADDQTLIRAGMDGLETTLEATFGTKIDRYVYMDLSAFKNIVDIIGGVEVDVPYDLHYSDPAQNLYIDLKAGLQTLDGAAAEQYVRFRKGFTEGDLGRLDAQRIFLAAVADKLLSSINISTLPRLAQEAYDKVITDFTLDDLIYFANKAKDITTNNIVMYTACGQPFTSDSGASMYSLYMKENLEIINKSFNVYKEDITKKNVTLNEQANTGVGRKDTAGKTVADEMVNPDIPLWNNRYKG